MPNLIKPGSSSNPNHRFIVMATIALVISVAGVILNIFKLATGNNDWQYILTSIFSLVSIGINIIAFMLVLRNQITFAGGLWILYALLNGFLTVFLFSGLGLIIQIIVTLVGVTISFETLSGRSRMISSVLTSIAGLIILSLDFVSLPWRVESLTPEINQILVIVILGFLGVYVFFNFSTYGIRTRILFIVLGTNLLAVILVSMVASFLTSEYISQNADRKLLATSRSLASEVDAFIAYNLDSIRIKANSPSLTEFLSLPVNKRENSLLETQVLMLLNDWSRQDSFFIESFSILDQNGVNILDSVIIDIGKEEKETLYFQKILEDGLSYCSPILFDETGKSVWFFSSPIRNKQKEIVGVLRLRYRAEVIQSFVVNFNDRSGKQSFGVVLDEYNLILAHGKEPSVVSWPISELNENEISRLQESKRLLNIINWMNFPALKAKLVATNTEQTIVTELLSVTGQIPANAAIVPLTNQPWKVVFFQPQKFAREPIRIQTNVLILVAESVGLVILVISGFATQIFTLPILRLTSAADRFAHGDLHALVEVNSMDEVGTLSNTFNSMASQLRIFFQGLEARVQERTQAIENSADIGRRLITILEKNTLLQAVIDQLQQFFNFYQVQIYLFDESGKNLTLAAATGEVGQRLLDQGYFIPFGKGLVGRSAESGQVILVTDTLHEPGWIPNPLLPETRSELAVPITLDDKVIGILNVHQNKPNGLEKQDAYILLLVASQTAIALRNAQLLEEARLRVDRQRNLNQIIEEIRHTTDLERAAKIAVREIGRVVGSRKSLIKYQGFMNREND